VHPADATRGTRQALARARHGDRHEPDAVRRVGHEDGAPLLAAVEAAVETSGAGQRRPSR
jgi:hypothetical protein